ncbi:MAG: S24 family peptidase [Candidatus Latescibacteria bacterium]|nr:S24 family peptidase [Candidatus Latescibacterota bacterium]
MCLAIHSGDILIIDRAVEPANNSVVVAMIDGEFTAKRIKMDRDSLFLVPENDEYEPIEIRDEL